MKHNRKKRHRKRPPLRMVTPPGGKPGTVLVDPDASPTRVRVMAYNREKLLDKELHHLDEVPQLLKEWPVTWINVDGLGNAAILLKLGKLLGLHELALEDVVNVHQRAKVEPYEDHLYIVARMVEPGERAATEQVSLFLGRNFVLTFQERLGDCFDAVRQRLRLVESIMRSDCRPDYLVYRLLDAIIDGYFPVLERYGDRLEALDDELADHPTEATYARIHDIKSDLLLLRRTAWPHRDAVSELLRESHELISPPTRVYLRDCYDHVLRVVDFIETYRELCANMRDFYLTAVSNRLNEIMKVLTIIATLFIPLSFIAGLYGMNFDTRESPWNMPELEWYFGYPLVLLLMGGVAGGMLLFFRKRGWLGHSSSPRSGENKAA